MVLRMPSPTKHPKTGVYYLRVRVPADVIALLGKKFLVKSLGTKDPHTAKALFASELQKAQRHWEALKQGPAPIPHRQLVALAGKHYGASMKMLDDEPGEPRVWEAALAHLEEVGASSESRIQWFSPSACKLLDEEGLSADQASFDRLIVELHSAAVQWAEQQLKRSKGDYSPDPQASRFPAPSTTSYATDTAVEGISLSDLFELWKRDHLAEGKSTRTVSDFQQKLGSFIAFLGHETAQRVTAKNVAEWCEDLRHNQGLGARTVSDKYLAALKAVFRVGVSKFKIASDPTANVKIKYNKKPQRERSLGFTDAEALTILSESLREPSALGGMAKHNKLAIRWGPWICAYTGARVGEIMQLRRSDLIEESGIPCLRNTPEAGSTKNGNYRIVPVHPHLIDLGLLTFIEEQPDGPLFYTPKRSGDDPVVRAGNTAKKIGAWVRETAGVTDSRIWPNHAWRHRFKTIARDVGMPPEYMDVLQGHEDGRSTASYGETTVRALYREIQKLPRYSSLEIDRMTELRKR